MINANEACSPIVLTVMLPVRNDGINLKIMLKMLKATLEVPHEVLVVHDDPDDDSRSIVQSMQCEYTRVTAVHNRYGRGIINAIRFGVEMASGEYVLIFAADEVGPVLAVDEMLRLMEAGCDFVSCTRYAHGGRRLGGSFIGGCLSRFANNLFHRLSGMELTDATTGIKMFRREIFNALKLEASPIGWAVAFEMSIKAQLAGLKLGEVPIISIDRLYGGKSTFKALPWIREYLKWFIWGMVRLPKPYINEKQQILVRVPKFLPLKEN